MSDFFEILLYCLAVIVIGRNHELSRIAGRIGTGQSTIITGSPRGGKTFVLNSLPK
jgi:transcription termination factor Rho